MQSVKLSSPNYVSCDWLFNAWCKATLLAEARCGFKQSHSAKYSVHTKTKIFLLFNVYDMIRSVLKCRFGPIVLELCRIKMRTIWCGTIHVETAEEYEHSAQAHVTLFFSDKFKFNSNIVTTIYNTQVLLLCGRCSSGLHCSFLKPATYAPGFCRLSISVACATEMQVCAAILILACVWLWRFRMYKRLLQFCTAGTCYYTSC